MKIDIRGWLEIVRKYPLYQQIVIIVFTVLLLPAAYMYEMWRWSQAQKTDLLGLFILAIMPNPFDPLNWFSCKLAYGVPKAEVLS